MGGPQPDTEALTKEISPFLGRILGTPEGRARLPLLGDDAFRALQEVKDMMLFLPRTPTQVIALPTTLAHWLVGNTRRVSHRDS